MGETNATVNTTEAATHLSLNLTLRAVTSIEILPCIDVTAEAARV